MSRKCQFNTKSIYGLVKLFVGDATITLVLERKKSKIYLMGSEISIPCFIFNTTHQSIDVKFTLMKVKSITLTRNVNGNRHYQCH